MLGASITANCSELARLKEEKFAKFFDKLITCPIHPQLQWTILRLCGVPKLKYWVSVMPPQQSLPLATKFQAMLKDAAESVVDAQIPESVLYVAEGAGFVDFAGTAKDEYDRSTQLTKDKGRTDGSVLRAKNSILHAADPRARMDLYLFFGAAKFVRLTPSQFQVALCLRLGVLPRWLHPPERRIDLRCACSVTNSARGRMLTPEAFVKHALMCKSFAKYQPATRHNDLRDAMAAVARSYGFTVVVEPNFYVYLGSDTRSGRRDGVGDVDDAEVRIANRPDITFALDGLRCATDVAITYPIDDSGGSAAHIAQQKHAKHDVAVARMGDQFIPFVVETDGRRDPCCKRLVDKLATVVLPHMRREFVFQFWSAVSCELARGRAKAVMSAYAAYVMP
jgi:hypothetical protein